MAVDIRQSTLSRALEDVITDVSELAQKELRLARAELSANATAALRRILWMALAGVSAMIAVLLLVEAAVFALASAGWAMHWACLIVAAALASLALIAFLVGRTANDQGLQPRRTLLHISQDVRTAMERLT
jgi:hypothetical protein